jgi:hypothetical protein
MWAILFSAANFLLGWIFRAVVVKFIVFTALYWIVTEITNAAIAKVSTSGMDGLGGLVSGLPADLLFFLKVFRLDVGLPMIIAACVVRFGIRRLPIIG